MSGFVGRLRATLGLDSAEFSTGLRGARQEAQGFTAAIGTGMRVLRAGILGISAGAAVQSIRTIMRDVAQIGDEAQRAGLSVEAFQEWAQVAAQARIPIDSLTDGFKEMSLRADEFIVTAGGAGAEAFTRLGFTVEDLGRRLQDPSELFLEIVRRLQRLDSAARIRIADEIFGGTGGERFVALIDRGAEGISEIIRRTRDAGAVWSEEIVAHAAEIDARFDALATRISYYGQRVLVGWGMMFDGALGTVAGAADPLQDAVDALEGEYSTMAAESLEAAYAMQALADAAAAAADPAFARAFLAIAAGLEVVSDEFTAGRASGQEFRAALARIVTQAGIAFGAVDGIDDISLENAKSVIEALRRQLLSLQGQAIETAQAVAAATLNPARQVESFWDTDESRFSLNRFAPTTSPRPRPAPDNIDFGLPPAASDGGGSSDGYAAAVADIRARTEALMAEAAALTEVAASGVDYGDAVEYARIRAELLTAAMAEGREITPQLTAEIEALASAEVLAQGRVDDLTDALERQQEAGERGAQALTDIFSAALQGGDAARNAVARLILEIARMQMMRGFQSLIGSGGGGFLSSLGSLLLGKNARGTVSWRGGMSLVGEEGPEIIDLPAGTSVTPALKSARMLRNGGGGGGTVDVRMYVDQDGNWQAAVERISGNVSGKIVGAYDRNLPGRVRQIQANPRRSH